MKWNKKVSTILSIFLILSLILVNFGYAVNTTANDIDPHSDGLADSPWLRYRGNNQGTGLSPYNTSFVEGMEKWNITLRDNVTYKIGDERYNATIASQPVISNNGTIYVCTSDGYIYAIKDGKEIWNFNTRYDGDDIWDNYPGTWIADKSPAIGPDGTLYYASGNKLHALGPSSPTVDITRPSSGESMNTKSVKLEWESTTIGSDIDHFKVRLDGDDWQNVGSVDEFELTDVSVGDHTAEVKAVAESNNYDIDSIEFTVEEDTTPPTADAGDDRTVKVDEDITFDASGSSDNREIINYEWDFDDDTTANGETVTHKFDGKGTYEVKLTVTDEAGKTDTDTLTVTVEKKEDNGIPGFTLRMLLISISLTVLRRGADT